MNLKKIKVAYIVFGSHFIALVTCHFPQMNQVHFVCYQDHRERLTVKRRTQVK